MLGVKMETIITETLSFIKNYFKNDSSGHDFYHSLRVFKLATAIAQNEPCNLLTVQLAALLHDVDDRKITDNQVPFINTIAFLSAQDLPSSQIKFICSLISEISYKGTDTQIPDTIEGKIVQDADYLDALGAIGIARTFTYGGSIGRSIYEPDTLPNCKMDMTEYYASTSTTINHFYEKLLKLPNLMNTVTGKAIAQHRLQFMNCFLQEFFNEWDCNLEGS